MQKEINKEQNDTIHELESDHGARKNQAVQMNETKKQKRNEVMEKVKAEVAVVNDDFLVA